MCACLCLWTGSKHMHNRLSLTNRKEQVLDARQWRNDWVCVDPSRSIHKVIFFQFFGYDDQCRRRPQGLHSVTASWSSGYRTNFWFDKHGRFCFTNWSFTWNPPQDTRVFVEKFELKIGFRDPNFISLGTSKIKPAAGGSGQQSKEVGTSSSRGTDC